MFITHFVRFYFGACLHAGGEAGRDVSPSAQQLIAAGSRPLLLFCDVVRNTWSPGSPAAHLPLCWSGTGPRVLRTLALRGACLFAARTSPGLPAAKQLAVTVSGTERKQGGERSGTGSQQRAATGVDTLDMKQVSAADA